MYAYYLSYVCFATLILLLYVFFIVIFWLVPIISMSELAECFALFYSCTYLKMTILMQQSTSFKKSSELMFEHITL
jgi:hypothetical protein